MQAEPVEYKLITEFVPATRFLHETSSLAKLTPQRFETSLHDHLSAILDEDLRIYKGLKLPASFRVEWAIRAKSNTTGEFIDGIRYRLLISLKIEDEAMSLTNFCLEEIKGNNQLGQEILVELSINLDWIIQTSAQRFSTIFQYDQSSSQWKVGIQ